LPDGTALLYDRRNIEEARRDLTAWLTRWAPRHPKLCGWVEDNIEDTLSFYRLPREHHKNLKSTNMLERIMEEIKRRTLVVRIFPNAAGCLRLVRALAVEMQENWIEAIRYLNMEPLREQNKGCPAPDRGCGVIAAGLYSAKQEKGPQSPAPSLHPTLAQKDGTAQNDFAELDEHN
jgi:hypothetical protein